MEPGNLIQLKNEEYDWPEIENGRVISLILKKKKKLFEIIF